MSPYLSLLAAVPHGSNNAGGRDCTSHVTALGPALARVHSFTKSTNPCTVQIGNDLAWEPPFYPTYLWARRQGSPGRGKIYVRSNANVLRTV